VAGFAVYASTYGVRVFGTVASLLTSIMLARGLGPAGRGDVTAFIAGVGLLVQFCSIGLSSSSVIELGERPDRARQVGSALVLAAIAVLPVALIASLILDRFAGTSLDKRVLALAVAWPVMQILALNLQSAFLGLTEYRWFNGMEVASRSLSLGLVAWQFTSPFRSPTSFLVALFAAESCVAVVALIVFWRKYGGWCRPDREVMARLVATGLRAYMAMLPAYVLIRSDVLMVRAWRGAVETGIYSVAVQVVVLMWMLPQVAGQVLFSHIARSADRARDTARVTAASFWVLLAACALAAILGRPAIAFAFGDEFVEAYSLLLILLPGALLLGMETTLVQYFNAHGFPMVIVKYWVAAMTVNLVINGLAIRHFGAVAAAVTSTAGYAVIYTLVVRRFLHVTHIPLRDLFAFPSVTRTPSVAL
jgi:enterobacterial common antigen flippase